MKIAIIVLLLLSLPYFHWLGVGAGFNLGFRLSASLACEGREPNCEYELLKNCSRLKIRCN